MPRSRLAPLAVLAALAALLVPALTTAAPGVVDPPVPAARETDAVVLTGAAFGLDGDWVAPQNVTARAPGGPDGGWVAPQNRTESPPESYVLECLPAQYPDVHNHHSDPTLDSST